MANQCIKKNCTAAPMNKSLLLKTGGTAKCPYCPTHATDKFVVPAAATVPAPVIPNK